MKTTLREMVESERFKNVLKQGLDSHKVGQDIVSKIETIIDKRLNELTPQLVKEMVKKNHQSSFRVASCLGRNIWWCFRRSI